MATGDDVATSFNPLSYAFWANQNANLTPEQIKRRMAVAGALASQRRGYPKNLGEGIASLGSDIGDALAERRLTAQENALLDRYRASPNARPPGTVVTPAAATTATPTVAPGTGIPPSVAAGLGLAAPPAASPPAAVGPRADLTPDEEMQRQRLAALTAPGGAQENPTVGAETPLTPGGLQASAASPDIALARRAAARSIESGGRRDPYRAIGPETRGDRPYGAYQIMGRNIGPWTEQHLGQRMSPEQFLASDEAQNTVFDRVMANYANRYGEEGAARAWFGGPGAVNKPGRFDNLGTTVGGYGQRYLAALNAAGGGGGDVGGGGGGGRVQLASLTPPGANLGGSITDAVTEAIAQAQRYAPAEGEVTPTDVQPAPRTLLAQAGGGGGGGAGGAAVAPPAGGAGASGGLGTIPGVFDTVSPRPMPTPQQIPAVDPAALKPIANPPAPKMQEHLTDEELRGLALKQEFPGLEQAQQMGDALIKFGAERRKADYDRLVKEWEVDQSLRQARTLAEDEHRRKYPQTQFAFTKEQQDYAKKIAEDALFPYGKDKAIERAKESFADVKQLPAAQLAINSVKELLASDAGMFTGSDANIALSLSKWARVLGAPDTSVIANADKVKNTETFKGLITPLLAALRPAIVGAGAQSLPEFKLLQDAAAGNITLERGSIEKILAAVQKLNGIAAITHQQVLMAQSGGDERARQYLAGSYPLPMEKFIPPGQVRALRESIASHGTDADKIQAELDDFDKAWFTPGLGRKLLMSR